MMINKLSAASLITLFLTVFLLLIGWSILYSAANGHQDEWANKQLYTSSIVLIVNLMIAFIHTKYFFKFTYYFFAVCILLLVTAEFIGHTAMGAQRWVKVGNITIQPSELTKIGIILTLARIFSQMNLQKIAKMQFLLIPLLVVMIPVLIILKQPNLGTSAIIILIAGAMFFVVGVQTWKFIAVIISCIASTPIIWNFLHDYQKKRVMTFLNPEDDVLGAGYNIMQSKIAIGSGGWNGKGLMQGTQVQLSFLPEKHTDFVFTILAEEYGFSGVILCLIIYLLLIYTIYFIALRVKNNYSKFICIGVASMLFFHVFINIGMVSGLLPVVGTPLPLLSYGRSNLVTTLIGIGLVLNADINRKLTQIKLQ